MPPTKFIRRQARKYGRKYGIPVKVLMGLMEQESGFSAGATSSAGARGLTQFIPSTARSYGVKYGTSKKAQKTQIRGAAHYLKDLGGSKKGGIRTALGNYYGSTSSPYASEVLAKSKKYKGTSKSVGGGGGGKKAKGKKADKQKVKKGTIAFRKMQEKGTSQTIQTAGAQDFEKQRQLARLAFVQKEDKSALDYAGFVDEMESLKDVPAQYETLKGSKTVPGEKVKAKVKGEKGKDKEKGKKKGGKKGGKKMGGIVKVGHKMESKFGAHVGEHPKFGGVGGGHVSGSYHYRNQAVDISGGNMQKMFNWIEKHVPKNKIAELFYDGNPYYYKHGQRVSGQIGGHSDHVHFAVER